MAFNLDGLARTVREFTLPFQLGVGGHAKVRELKALRALKETPDKVTPEDLQYLGDLGHTEVTYDDRVQFSPRGRQRFVDLENLVKTIIPQENPASNPTAPPVGALPGGSSALSVMPQPGPALPTTRIPNVSRGALPAPGLLDPNDPLAWLRKS